MNLVECIDEILMLGLDDWIQVSEIASAARTVGGAVTQGEVQRLSLDIIRAVIKEGLMTVGDVTTQGFQAWALSAEESLERIEREWIALGRNPSLGDICWLSNTEEGDKRARTLIAGAT
ncbi:MAG: hypothetical protein HUU21_32095 [Polyangiaceae bacterium]|nr:hypothetical protein [Polyangiaceae bacterium]